MLNEEHVVNIAKELNSFYGEIVIHRGRTMEYLGIVFDYSDEEYLEISMDKYMEYLAKDSGVTGIVNTPATEDLFHIEKESPLLNDEESAIFHSIVAKLLYPPKRVRMDLQLAVGFLTTRLQKPIMQDRKKLDRVLRYINGTTRLKLRVKESNLLLILA